MLANVCMHRATCILLKVAPDNYHGQFTSLGRDNIYIPAKAHISSTILFDVQLLDFVKSVDNSWNEPF